MGCSSHQTDELYYRAGGTNKSQKRNVRDTDSHCPCANIIKAVLSECCCSKAPRRVSVFERISTRTSEVRPRHFRRRKPALQEDEFPEVSVNMTGRGKSTRHFSQDQFATVSQCMTRLRSGTNRRKDYQRMQKGLPSDDEISDVCSDACSDACSAMAFDDTASSAGQPYESLMTSAEQMAKILEDALTKQKENFKFEMKMAMQQMREMHDQQITMLTTHQGESSRRNNPNQGDNEREVNENVNMTTPPVDNNTGNGPSDDSNTKEDHATSPRNRPKEDTGEDKKMRDLESKINALMSAQEVKRSGIPCPYPREWESIPYPTKFKLINFTPFDGMGSPTQHLIYFKSHLGIISGNEL
uniref:Uncharacterized protein n=1 Tax=Asparagus officinalis TaxID=4686 RepID=Q2XNY2_ASPOF|nr:hypothetical protein 10.t00034 [Asparagus officinalis]